MNEYLERIKDLIAETAGLERDEVTRTSFFEGDLNVGEMEMLEILSTLEEEFHVELMEGKENYDTVEDLIEALTEQAE